METTLLLLVISMCGFAHSHNDGVPPPKTWYFRKITDHIYVSGRLTAREIKYAAESGFEGIISIFPYNNTLGSDPDALLPTTTQAQALAASIGISHNTILDHGVDEWQSVAAVGKLRDILRSTSRPILVHCDVSFASTFILLSHFFNATYHNDIKEGELAITGDEVFKMASRFGFSYNSTNMTAMFREFTGNASAEYEISSAEVSFPTWYLGYWHSRPVFDNWFIAGQIQKHHLQKINATLSDLDATNSSAKRITIINLRQDVNSQSEREEVTLLNIEDGTGSGRQEETKLLSSLIDANKPTSYISDTSTLNYEAMNSREFGDEVGYNETMEREHIESVYGNFINYIHIPLPEDRALTAEEYQMIRPQLVEADRSTMVIVHSASLYRAGQLAFLAVGDLKNRSAEWINETSIKYLRVGVTDEDRRRIQGILDPSSISRCNNIMSSFFLIYVSFTVCATIMW